jgi:hypothetical protein
MKARPPFSDKAIAAFAEFDVPTQVVILEYLAIVADKPPGTFLVTAEHRKEKRRRATASRAQERAEARLKRESKALWDAGNRIYAKGKARERRTGKHWLTPAERRRLRTIHRRMDANDRALTQLYRKPLTRPPRRRKGR